ncbi:MAG: CHAT domain-containing protein [Bacteroidota bacterium]
MDKNATLLPQSYDQETLCLSGDTLLIQQAYIAASKAYQMCLHSTELSSLDSLYLVNQIVYAHLQLYDVSTADAWAPLMHQLQARISSTSTQVQADIAFNQGRRLFLHHRHLQSLGFLHRALNLYRSIPHPNKLRVGQVLTTITILQYEFHPTADSLAYYSDLAFDHFTEDTLLAQHQVECYFAKSAASLYDRAHNRGEAYAQFALERLKSLQEPQAILAARTKTLLGNMHKKNGDLTQINTPTDTLAYHLAYKLADSLIAQGMQELRQVNSSFWQESFRDWVIMAKRFAPAQPQLLRQRLQLHSNEFQSANDFYIFPNRLMAYDFVGKDRDSMIFYYEKFLVNHLKRPNTSWQLQDEAYYRLRMGYTEQGDFDRAITNLLKGEALFGCCSPEDSYLDYAVAKNAARWSTPCLNGLVELINILLEKNKVVQSTANLQLAAGYLDTLDKYWLGSILRSDEDALLTYFTEVGKEVYPNAISVMYKLWQESAQDDTWVESFHFAERMKSFLSYRNQFAQWHDRSNIRTTQATVNRLNRIRSYRSLTEVERNQWVLAQDSLEKMLISWRSDSTAFINAHRQTRFSLNDIRSKLTEEEALLHLTYLEGEYYVHYIDADEKALWRIEDASKLQQLTQDYKESLSSISRLSPQQVAKYQRSAESLFQLFLQPVYECLSQRSKLIIVTDGPLADAPFEALLSSPSSGQAASEFDQLPYLIKTHQIQYAASWKTHGLRGAETRLSSTSSPTAAIWTSSQLAGGQALGTLHETILEQPSYTHKLFVDSTSTFFLEQAPGMDLIHCSLHARSSTRNRHENAIYFSDTDTLFGHDIAALSLSADLVVLAACESAAGSQFFGEGTFSLVRSFQLAGVRHVVAGLWRIPEEATAVLLQTFYEHLNPDLSNPTAALQMAKWQLIHRPPKARMAFPGFWAGVIIQ